MKEWRRKIHKSGPQKHTLYIDGQFVAEIMYTPFTSDDCKFMFTSKSSHFVLKATNIDDARKEAERAVVGECNSKIKRYEQRIAELQSIIYGIGTKSNN